MNKRTFRLIWKGTLLYITIIMTILFASSVDSLSEEGLAIGIVIVTALIYACKKVKYSNKELHILSGEQIWNKLGL